MANVVATSVYQLNQHVIPLAQVTSVGFPTQGCVLGDCFNSPQRALSTGVSVYSFVTTAAGDKYYCQQTLAQLVTLFG